jgi:hypothetical protein
MKWFEKLFDNGESDSEKMMKEDKQRAGIGSFSTLNDITEEIKETKKLVEEHKEKVEEVKPPKEMLDISVKGSYKFEIIEREEYYSGLQCRHFVRFHYNVVVNFIGEEIKIKSHFNLSPDFADRRTRGFVVYGEEMIYGWLAELLQGDGIMNELQDNIKLELRKYVKDKNIAKLKETIEKNNNFDINLNFQVEKTSAYEIK